MIAGVGTDIVSIARIREAIRRHEGRFARKVLSNDEWAIFASQKDGAPFVAKRFAAKEAFYKAFGEPPGTANTWHQLSILNDAAGRPRMEYGPLLAARIAERGITGSHVSLSDEREYAVACVILERM